MKTRHGKKIDLAKMSKGLNKSTSVATFRQKALAISVSEELAACPLCGGTKRDPLATIYGFRWVSCHQCTAAYVLNQPNEEQIASLYRAAEYAPIANAIHFDSKLQAHKAAHVTLPKVRWVMDVANVSDGNWLDIGCGAGDLLLAAQQSGFAVRGVETNEAAVAFIQDSYEISIDQDFIDRETILRYRQHCDVVSLIGVLEHQRHPRETIEAIASIQRKGQLLLIEVPHYPSIAAYSQMANPELVNRVMVPPYHLHLYNIDALERLLAPSGYSTIGAWYFGMDIYEHLSTLSTAQEGLGESALMKTLLSLSNELQQVVDDKRLSDSILLIAKKS